MQAISFSFVHFIYLFFSKEKTVYFKSFKFFNMFLNTNESEELFSILKACLGENEQESRKFNSTSNMQIDKTLLFTNLNGLFLTNVLMLKA
jgi:hypothetical protein